MTSQSFMDALQFRHACKLFDANKKLSDEERNYILGAARLSPSSFGVEHWKIVVIRNQELKEKLRPLCWNQPQITTCSDLVMILAKKQLTSDRPYIRKQFARWAGEKLDFYLDLYKNFIDPRGEDWIVSWSKHQCYLMSGILMTAAASIGVDSCPIEGMNDVDAVEKTLGIDQEAYALAYIVALGYRGKEQQPRHRLPIEEIVEFRE